MRRLLLGETVEDIDQLPKLLRPLGLPLLDALGNAGFDVEFQDGEADAVEGRLGGGELLEDVDAEPGFLHHPPDAPNLPLDPIEPGHQRLLPSLI